MDHGRVDTLRASGAGSDNAPLDTTPSENDRGREIAQGNLKIFSRLADVCDAMISSCHSRTRLTQRALARLTDVQRRDAARAHAAWQEHRTAPGHVRLGDFRSRDAAHAAQNAEQARSTLSAATDRYKLSLEHHDATIAEILLQLEMMRALATDESLVVHGIGASPAEANQHDPETLRLRELAQSHIQQEGLPSSDDIHGRHKRPRMSGRTLRAHAQERSGRTLGAHA